MANLESDLFGEVFLDHARSTTCTTGRREAAGEDCHVSESVGRVRSLGQAMNDAIVATLDQCAALLAQCKTADQAKRLGELSEAARVYAKRIGASREVVNRAAEYALRADWRLGEILAKSEKAKGAAGRGKKTGPRGTLVEPRDKTPKLDDVGIS